MRRRAQRESPTTRASKPRPNGNICGETSVSPVRPFLDDTVHGIAPARVRPLPRREAFIVSVRGPPCRARQVGIGSLTRVDPALLERAPSQQNGCGELRKDMRLCSQAKSCVPNHMSPKAAMRTISSWVCERKDPLLLWCVSTLSPAQSE